jgi:hypothetical protein
MIEAYDFSPPHHVAKSSKGEVWLSAPDSAILPPFLFGDAGKRAAERRFHEQVHSGQ